MGEYENTISVTGCPSVDLAAEVLENPKLDFDPFAKYGGVGSIEDISEGYMVVMQHPVTTQFGESLAQIEATLDAVEAMDMPTLWFWPNVDAGSDGISRGIRRFDGISRGIRRFREQGRGEKFHYFKNMEPEDFLRLIHNSQVIVGNSSVGIRESSYLGLPVVNIGERQKGRERGANVIDVPHDAKQIQKAIEAQIKNGRHKSDGIYGKGQAGEQIADLLAKSELTIAKQLSY
jgi:UDP-hydrolysing UDP-N-acetyl-D-glucosamine 2-epimerase